MDGDPLSSVYNIVKVWEPVGKLQVSVCSDSRPVAADEGGPKSRGEIAIDEDLPAIVMVNEPGECSC